MPDYTALDYEARTAGAHAVNAFAPYRDRITAATITRVPRARLVRALGAAVRRCIVHPPGSSLDAPTAEARANAEKALRLLGEGS